MVIGHNARFCVHKDLTSRMKKETFASFIEPLVKRLPFAKQFDFSVGLCISKVCVSIEYMFY